MILFCYFKGSMPKEAEVLEHQWASAILHRKARKHCTRWTYESRASFFDLAQSYGPTFNGTMYSDIKVYYADLGYRQYEETRQVSVYVAFCNFGNVIGLYLGMSIMSIFHVLYYVPRYFYVWVKWRVLRTPVVPILEASG